MLLQGRMPVRMLPAVAGLSADIPAQHFRHRLRVSASTSPSSDVYTQDLRATMRTFALDMPDTAARLIDSAVFMCMMRYCLRACTSSDPHQHPQGGPYQLFGHSGPLAGFDGGLSCLAHRFSKGFRTGQFWLAPSDSYSAGGAGLGQTMLYPFVTWPQNPPPHPRLPLAASVHAPGARHGTSLICSLVLRRYRSSHLCP